MKSGLRRQEPPREKCRSGYQTAPALSVLGGPEYPASSRTGIADASIPGGTDSAATDLLPGFARSDDAPLRRYRYAPEAARTKPVTSAPYVHLQREARLAGAGFGEGSSDEGAADADSL